MKLYEIVKVNYIGGIGDRTEEKQIALVEPQYLDNCIEEIVNRDYVDVPERYSKCEMDIDKHDTNDSLITATINFPTSVITRTIEERKQILLDMFKFEAIGDEYPFNGYWVRVIETWTPKE